MDASVAIAWSLGEDNAERARGLLSLAYPKFAPQLWRYEYTNALRSAVRQFRIDASAATRLLDSFTWPVEFSDPPMSSMLATALEFDISAYDAAYLALAEALAMELWTCDRRLVERVRDARPGVHHISELTLPAP